MSGRLVQEVFKCAPIDLTPTEVLVMLSLAETARESDRQARYHCSVEDIAERTHLALGTVRNVLSALAARGLIRRVHAKVHAGGKHQEYVLAKLSTAHRFATHRDGARQ